MFAKLGSSVAQSSLAKPQTGIGHRLFSVDKHNSRDISLDTDVCETLPQAWCSEQQLAGNMLPELTDTLG